MKIAYFDTLSGISGDMILGALLDLGISEAELNVAVRSVFSEAKIEPETVRRKGFRATQAKVIVPHEHVHRHLSDILEMIAKSAISQKQKQQASDIFRLIAEAEANVHGTDVESVHFHEVGAADSITDIVGAVVGLDLLGVDEIRASAVPTGCGTVRIAHGTCSVPAPATAELLRGIPLADSDVPFELTTPTGAAILKYYVRHFGPMPAMTIHAVGVGAGGRDLEQQANVLRVLVGEMEHAEHTHTHDHHHHHTHEHGHDHDHPHAHSDSYSKPQTTNYKLEAALADATCSEETVWQLETNLDDLTGELIGHCVERLWATGPLDVWTTPIMMKKQRPGVTLSVLCRRENVEAVKHVLFTETSTLGVRCRAVERTVLPREACKMSTPWGEVDAVRATLPDGTQKIAPEFESAKRLAEEHNVPLREVMGEQVNR